jgi:probable HAF family extracellular repeat protein
VGETDFPNPPLTIPFTRRDPFIWTADGGFQDLGVSGCAYAVSADGSVVVGQASSQLYPTAFIWTQAGGMQDLGTLPGLPYSLATGVSDDGQVVVGFSSDFGVPSGDGSDWDFFQTFRPFVWTAANGIQDLNGILANAGVDLTGITLLGITGVSTDGQFVCGVARTPQNDPNDPSDFSGFIAHLPQ